MRTFKVLITIISCMLYIMFFTHRVSQSLLIGGILSYFNSNGSNKTNLEYALICAFGLALSMFASIILYHSSQIEILHCGMKIRVACCSIIYRKV